MPITVADEYSPSLDQHYIIGPTIAREIGYRILWQTQVNPMGHSGITEFTVHDDSVFVLDGQNFLTRISREEGDRIWNLAVEDPIVEIQGITYLPEKERVYLTAGGDLLELDAANGAQVDRQRLSQMASTRPVVFGPMMIYGSRSGQLVWHAYGVRNQWRAYYIAPTIETQPILQGDLIVTVSSDGLVAVLSAQDTSMYWSKQLLDAVVSTPAVGNGAVFVSGRDQNLWAFDLGNGRRLWKYLTESPLTASPSVIGDRVYQYIPTEGLVCLTAVPRSAPGGEVKWTCAEARGEVLAEHQGVLHCWDAASKTLFTIAAGSGHLVDSISLPRVRHLLAPETTSGDIFAASDDGRIIRLTPR